MSMVGSGVLHSYATVSEATIARMPRGLSFEEAAQLPMVFMTVEFALGPDHANLQKAAVP